MSRVYSTQLAAAPSFTGGPTTVYTVPSGIRAVVRTVSIVWGNLTLSGLDVWVQNDSLVKLCRRTVSVGFQDYLNQGGCDVFTGWWVLNESEELQFQTTSGTVDIYVSGHELALP